MMSFRNKVLKVDGPRVHKVNKSLGVYQAYKYIRKNKWFDIGRPLTEHQFYYIIRHINELLSDNLLEGKDLILPHRMGRIEIRKIDRYVRLDDKGNIHTNAPVDWDSTLKLWAEDDLAYKDKILVRTNDKEFFKVYYNKAKANYNNKSFYEFAVNRDLKLRLKHKIKRGNFDAFKL